MAMGRRALIGPTPAALAMNDIAHVTISLAKPIFVDAYNNNEPCWAQMREANIQQILAKAGFKAGEEGLKALGYDAEHCLTDFGQTAEAVVTAHLKRRQFDCVMIGAGVRTVASNFLLFEKLINVVHEHAPRSKICFNTKPSDTLEALQRWI